MYSCSSSLSFNIMPAIWKYFTTCICNCDGKCTLMYAEEGGKASDESILEKDGQEIDRILLYVSSRALLYVLYLK